MAHEPYRQPVDYDPDIGKGEEYDLKAPSSRPVYDRQVDKAIIGWRALCFMEAGFSMEDVVLMARRRDVDRGEVERLLEKGATHDQVREIVL